MGAFRFVIMFDRVCRDISVDGYVDRSRAGAKPSSTPLHAWPCTIVWKASELCWGGLQAVSVGLSLWMLELMGRDCHVLVSVRSWPGRGNCETLVGERVGLATSGHSLRFKRGSSFCQICFCLQANHEQIKQEMELSTHLRQLKQPPWIPFLWILSLAVLSVILQVNSISEAGLKAIVTGGVEVSEKACWLYGQCRRMELLWLRRFDAHKHRQ